MTCHRIYVYLGGKICRTDSFHFDLPRDAPGRLPGESITSHQNLTGQHGSNKSTYIYNTGRGGRGRSSIRWEGGGRLRPGGGAGGEGGGGGGGGHVSDKRTKGSPGC